jgi:hypothetical protein
MNREEARRILLACRSGTSDMEDPEVRAALELAARDPELAEWWRDQCRVQESLWSAFRNLPVPADLKDSILAANKVVSVGWWRTTGFRAAALAAVLVLLL